MTLKFKLIGGLILILIAALSCALYGIIGSRQIIEGALHVENEDFPILSQIQDLEKIVADTRKTIIYGYDELDEVIFEDILFLKDEFIIKSDSLKLKVKDKELDDICDSYLSYVETAEIMLKKHISSGGKASIEQEIASIGTITFALNNKIRIFHRKKESAFRQELFKIRSYSENFKTFFLLMGQVLLILVMLIVSVTVLMVKDIQKLVKFSDKLSQGDLRNKIIKNRNDEIGVLQSSFEKMRMSLKDMIENLDMKVNERTRQLQITQEELVRTARDAGMADIATGIIHNIGNVLNSLNISCAEINQTIEGSKLPTLKKMNQLLIVHREDLGKFFSEDEKAKLLPELYDELDSMLSVEQKNIIKEVNNLMLGMQLMKDIVSRQQEFAKVGVQLADENINKLIREVLELEAHSLGQNSISVEMDLDNVSLVKIDKVKFSHVLVNLIKNAVEAMLETPVSERVLKINLKEDADKVYLSLLDTGEGIYADQLSKIFNYGYTTKKNGHGFGLHSCANAIQEMSGEISVHSEGRGSGACFTIKMNKQ